MAQRETSPRDHRRESLPDAVTVEDARTWLAAIVDSSDDAIIGKRLDGTIVSWNKAATRLFGYEPQEIIGRSVLTLIPADRHDEEPRIIERLSRGERVEHFEAVRRRKDGTLVQVSLSVSPIRAASGVVIGAAKIARDITEELHVREQLQAQALELESQMEEAQALSEELEHANEELQETSVAAEESLEAERLANDRARRLLAVSSGLSGATTPQELADVIFREGMSAVEADAGSLALVRGEASAPQELEIVRTSGFPQSLAERYHRFPLKAGRPVSDALLSGAPRLIRNRAEWQAAYPEVVAEMGETGYAALAAVPIIVGDRKSVV